LSGYLAGYNGSFEFKSGETYPADVNYTFMRQFNAFWGAVCVPMAYWTAKELNLRRATVWLITLMVLCENSYTTISRFILLDSMLLFGTVATTLCWAKFHGQRRNSFEPEWFFWLTMTGLSIGFVTSVKLVGLFVTALVGLYTVEDLWRKFGDTKMPLPVLGAHLAARVVGLIILPLLVYMLSFAIHFAVLSNSGPGDAQMSSLFQANLRGTEVGRNSPLEIALGSRVTIKNMDMAAVYSTATSRPILRVPTSNKLLAITTKMPTTTGSSTLTAAIPRMMLPRSPASLVTAPLSVSSMFRLAATFTLTRLLPPSPRLIGNVTVGDEKDHWKIEVVSDAASRDRSKIRTLTTAFRLKHEVLGCYLRAGNVNLPQWGFKQIEVTCTKDNKPRDTYTHWNIEAHTNEKRKIS